MRTWDFLPAAGIFRLRLGSMEFGLWGLRRVGREGDAFLVPGGQRKVVEAALLVLLTVQLRQQSPHRVGVRWAMSTASRTSISSATQPS